jgi:hypothetical protein
METTHSIAGTNVDQDGGNRVTDYRKLSNSELHRILCSVDARMSSFPVTDGTRETVIAMLEFAGPRQG